MHKLGLKIWSTNIFYIKPAIELYGKKILDYLELYVVPGSATEYLSKWEEVNLPIILHAPHSNAGFNLSLKDVGFKNRSLIREVEVFREALNPKSVIFHPGTNGSMEETIRQVNMFKNEFPGLFDLAVMENKPKMGLNGEICVGASPEEMKKALDETELGFCLDIGHAICYAAWGKMEYKNIIDQFIKLKPKMYHLSDGDVRSQTDMHLNFGKGNFDLQKIIRMIPQDAYVSIETNKRSQTDLDDFKEDALYFRMHADELKLRDVKDGDCRDLYDWRNHPIIRENSFNTSPFSFDEHQTWFKQKRQSSQTTIYIGCYKGHKVGVIRFEDEKDGIKVNVMLNPDYIGKGLGTRLIELGVEKLKQQNKTGKAIIAEIKEDNVASQKAFEKAGFKKNDLAYVFKS